MTRRIPVLLAAVTALALVAAGCGTPDPLEPSAPTDSTEPGDVDEPDDDAADDPEPDTDPPADDADDDPAPDPEPADAADSPRVVVFVTRASETTVYVEPVEVPVVPAVAPDTELTGEALDTAVMTTLFAHEPDDPDVGTAAPSDVEVLEVSRDGAVLVVDVDAGLLATSGGSAQELAFAQQLAHTAAALDGIDQVRLTVGGAPIDELWGHLGWAEPLEPDEFALSPITIVEPMYAAEVPAGAVTLEGEATVFEATFVLEVQAADGSVVHDATITASMGGPERGDWSETLTLDAPGTYTVVASEIDVSGGEGRPPFVTTRTFEVLPSA